MARATYIDAQPELMPIDHAAELLPGTFERAVNHLLDHAVDLSQEDARFRNDDAGAPASTPALLRTEVLSAYCKVS